jgi:hypothetical protein
LLKRELFDLAIEERKHRPNMPDVFSVGNLKLDQMDDYATIQVTPLIEAFRTTAEVWNRQSLEKIEQYNKAFEELKQDVLMSTEEKIRLMVEEQTSQLKA